MLPYHLKQTASDLKVFLRKPIDGPAAEQSTNDKLRVLLQVLFLNIVLSAGLSGLIEVVTLLGWYNSDSHAVAEMMRTLPAWTVLLLAVAVLPFLEELVFRFGLRFRRGYVAFLFVALLLVLGGYAFYLFPLVWAVAAAALLSSLLMLYLLKADAIGDYLEQVWPKIYRAVFYTVALLFGLVHITNFTNFDYTTAAILLIPLLIAPQVMGGLLMGYMRVKYGFFWGYFLHAGHNAFFVTLTLVFMDSVEEKLIINNESYALKVEEHVRLSPTATIHSYLADDSISFVNTKLSEVIVHLLQKEKNCVQFDKGQHLNRTLNLSYKSHTEANIQNRSVVLGKLQKLYKFDITISDLEQEMWELEIEDSTLLESYVADETGQSKVTVTPADITMENVTLNELLKAVNTEFYVTSSDKTAKAGKYNFRFARNGFDQLRDDLKSKYGLTMQAKKVLAEQAIVEFRK